MKALSVLVLRYMMPENREWKVPLNLRIGQTEIPLGLALITISLFALSVINVLTKKVATISGVSFTIAFFTCSIAVPALGCGLGGPDWHEVRPFIEQAFAGLPGVRVLLFEPGGSSYSGLRIGSLRCGCSAFWTLPSTNETCQSGETGESASGFLHPQAQPGG